MVDFSKLAEPFPPDAISWRVGSTTGDKTRGLPLCYIDARDVMDRLDEVVGPANWQCRYPVIGERTICEIGIRVGDEWVWKADGADDTDYEGVKGGLSDAMKRAAVRWGVGRYLYGLKAPWVSITAAGKSFKIVETELPKLMKMLPKPVQPAEVAKTQEPAATADPAKAVADEPTETKGKKSPDVMAKPEHADRPEYAAFIKDTPAGKAWKVTAIQAEMRAFCHDLEGVTDDESLRGLIIDNGPALDACALAQPKWWHGPIEGFEPIHDRIGRKRAEIKAAEREFNPKRMAG